MHLSKQSKFLSLILLFITFDVICDNYIASSFQNEYPIREGCIFAGLLLLQIIVSPIQSGISDIYGRKISFIVSISFSLLSLLFIYLFDLHVLAYLPMLILLILSKGIFGNTLPIAWASVGDMEVRNFRFSFALAIASYAIGYLVLIFLNKFLTKEIAALLLVLSFVFVLFFCIRFFNDLKDIRFRDIRRLETPFFEYFFTEISLIVKDIRNKSIQLFLIAWVLWSISIYTILLLYADFLSYESSVIVIIMMVGYLVGTLFMKFLSRIDDIRMIRIGYKLSVLSLIPYFVLILFFDHIYPVFLFCYFFHAIGNAFLSPTMFSIISKTRKEHTKGKLYGLIESADTIAFLISGIVILIYRHYNFDLFWLVSFSFLTVLIAWIPYRRFERKQQLE